MNGNDIGAAADEIKTILEHWYGQQDWDLKSFIVQLIASGDIYSVTRPVGMKTLNDYPNLRDIKPIKLKIDYAYSAGYEPYRVRKELEAEIETLRRLNE